ncbi:MAG: DNA primase [Parcubacteria group bacterium]|nr:DNA primase [Parcubacteria group bacterium]
MSQATEQIKDRIDIVDVVREYVPELKKTGINWKARCPFHQEKTPSFTVNPGKGFWHCFGCAKGGDIFSFIQEVEGIEFPDALRMLADRAGVTLEKADREQESKRSRTLELLRHAANWYHQALLKAKSAEYSRAYIAERAITDTTRDNWQLGFAPDAWEGVSTYLKSRGFRDDEIASAGISSTNDRGSQYDRFRNRLMFPIQDVHGSVVGFTARKLNQEDVGGKYINTPETEVYKKSSILYGLSQAKQEIRKQDLAVIVEGNMDVISSHQAGVTNVVASSGTALTPEHIKLLARYTKNIALAFDPDAAGQTAALRGLEVAWREDMSISVVGLPEAADPDNLIKQDSKKWQDAINHRVPLLDWVFGRATRENDITAAAGKKNAARSILSWIARVSDPIEQTHYLQKLSSLIHVDEAVLRGVLAKRRPAPSTRPRQGLQREPSPKPHILEQVSARVLALIILNPEYEIDPAVLAGEAFQELYKRRPELYDGRIEQLDITLQAVARSVLMIAEEYRYAAPEEKSREFKSLARRLHHHHIQGELGEIRSLITRAERSGDLSTLEQHLAQWQQLNQELQKHHAYANQKEDEKT